MHAHRNTHTLAVERAKGQRLGVDSCESKYHVIAGSHKQTQQHTLCRCLHTKEAWNQCNYWQMFPYRAVYSITYQRLWE